MSVDLDFAPIDEGMLSFYEALHEKSPPEVVALPLPEQRRAWDEVCRIFRAPRPEGVSVNDVKVPGHHALRLRIYRPAPQSALPGVLYFHGGGWVLGSLETHDDICAELAEFSRTVVVAVDYRLAPEHRHPAQLEDALAALAWMRGSGKQYGIDPSRILAAGDSAGGQMSAALALWLRDHGEEQLAGQILIYPVLGTDFTTASYMRNAEAPCLTLAEMQYFWASFLGPPGSPGWSDKYAVPLLETDLHGLPPAFLTAAAHDPLYDDAIRYAAKLQAAGVPAVLRREPALAHSYMRARRVSAPAKAGFAAIAEAVKTLAHAGRPA
jgi:acetyl esterase